MRSIPRGILAAGVALVLAGLLLWGDRGHREADRATARADSLATQILLERARADGWEATAADTTAQLLALLAASVASGILADLGLPAQCVPSS